MQNIKEMVEGIPNALNAKVILAALISSALITLVTLSSVFGGVKTNFEDAATFGAATNDTFGKVGDHSIHCHDSRDAADCLAGVVVRNAKSSVLWLGNSQLHAINQFRPGDTTGTPLLFSLLAPRGLDLVTFSQPNANLQEHYLVFEYLRTRLPIRMLILPVVFDDLREEGLRDEVAALARDDATAASLAKTEVGQRLLTISRAAIQDKDTAGIGQTMQEKTERTLNTWLETHSELWAARPTIRGEFLVGLYRLRNTVFGIKPSSKRKLIPGRYKQNWAALDLILSVAARNEIRVLLYVAPLRNDVETPYVPNEYAQFKLDLEKLGASHGVAYSNLENLVPANFWGTKESTGVNGEPELDFMHFQAGGHKIMAERLDQLVAEMLPKLETKR